MNDARLQIADAAKRLAANPDDEGAAHELLDLLPRIGQWRVRLTFTTKDEKELKAFLAKLAEHKDHIIETFDMGTAERRFVFFFSVPASSQGVFDQRKSRGSLFGE